MATTAQKATSKPRPRRRGKSAKGGVTQAGLLQLALLGAITDAGLPAPTLEHQFARAALGRQWRIDLAWIDERIALEIEGGIYAPGGGAHQRVGRGGRYLSDMEKYNTLAVWGWLLIRVTYDMIADGRALALLTQAFAYRRGQGDAA